MKKGLFILLLGSGIFHVYGKQPGIVTDSTATSRDSIKTKRKFHHYISLNTTFFIKQLFDLTGSTVSVTSSPYIFEYKMLYGDQGFRFDVGGSLSQKKQFLDSSQVTINNSQTFDFSLGYIFQKKIAKRWTFFAGTDMVAEISDSLGRTNSTIDILSNKTTGYTIGGGPSFGIQFDINKRVGFFTESALYYTYNRQVASSTSFNFPDLNTSTKTINNNFLFLIPVSLYFYVKIWLLFIILRQNNFLWKYDQYFWLSQYICWPLSFLVLRTINP